jgi:hypothetical protein
MSAPVIAFGQQPCGFFPRRFLVAKFITARRLCAELGGEIVFFYHDSDHDPRETQTGLRHRTTDELRWFNFAFENKLQRKYTPLYLKRVPAGWRESTARQLPPYVGAEAAASVKTNPAATVADFCLEQLRVLGFLEGVRVVRSSDPAVRRAACGVEDAFVDVPHEGEIVRARASGGILSLHEGGPSHLVLPAQEWTPEQVSPTRDTRLRWMQSVIRCTHYIAGAGEQAYLNPAETPEITFVPRDPIDRSDEAHAVPAG